MRRHNIRSLPPRERVKALRKMLRERLPHIPRAVVQFPSRKPAIAPSNGRRYRHGKGIHALAFAAGLLAATALALAPTRGAHAGTLDLNINLASYHFERWAHSGPYKLNQRNPGLGFTYHFDRMWAVAGGTYWNSYRRRTGYALAEWTPLHIDAANRWHLDAGLAGGLVSGYTRREVGCEPLAAAGLLRVVAPSGVAAELMIVPNQSRASTGFVGLQLAFPLR